MMYISQSRKYAYICHFCNAYLWKVFSRTWSFTDFSKIETSMGPNVLVLFKVFRWVLKSSLSERLVREKERKTLSFLNIKIIFLFFKIPQALLFLWVHCVTMEKNIVSKKWKSLKSLTYKRVVNFVIGQNMSKPQILCFFQTKVNKSKWGPRSVPLYIKSLQISMFWVPDTFNYSCNNEIKF